MLVDALLQHEVEGQVNKMVENVRGLEIKREVVEVAKEVVEVAKEMAEVAKEVVEMAKKVIRVVKEVVEQLQNLLLTIVAQVGNHINNQGNNKNQDDNVVNDNNQDYDGKGDAIVYTRWIEKMESVQDMSRYGENQKVKYTADSLIVKALTWWNSQLETEFWCYDMVRVGHAAYTDRFHEVARLVLHLVTLENKRTERYIYGLAPQIHAMVAAMEPTTIQSVVLKAGMLTDEAIRNSALKKISEKRGNNREPSRDGNVRDDNKRSRNGRAFATITNTIRK
ncbi:hypothetical protein Tco_0986157 [Tanacetum coccineum]